MAHRLFHDPALSGTLRAAQNVLDPVALGRFTYTIALFLHKLNHWDYPCRWFLFPFLAMTFTNPHAVGFRLGSRQGRDSALSPGHMARVIWS